MKILKNHTDVESAVILIRPSRVKFTEPVKKKICRLRR